MTQLCTRCLPMCPCDDNFVNENCYMPCTGGSCLPECPCRQSHDRRSDLRHALGDAGRTRSTLDPLASFAGVPDALTRPLDDLALDARIDDRRCDLLGALGGRLARSTGRNARDALAQPPRASQRRTDVRFQPQIERLFAR